MKSKHPRTDPAVAPDEPEVTLESHLAAGGQLWPTEDDVAKWDPETRMLLGAEFYAERDDIPPGEALERVKALTRRLHIEALERVKQLTEWLAGSLEELRAAAYRALSPEVKKIAQEALADLYVEIGKEYNRAPKEKPSPHLHSHLVRLLKMPAFRKRFDYRKSIRNHEQDATTPAMKIVVDALQSDGGLDWFLHCNMGRGDEKRQDEVWDCSVVCLIKEQWETLRARYLSAEKRQTFASWKKRLRDAFNVLWEERKIRLENELDFRFGPSNHGVSVARAKEMRDHAFAEMASENA